MAAKTARGQVAETVAASQASEETNDKKRADELSKQVLDNFLSIGKPGAAVRVMVYGEQKVGKTKFLSHCPGVVFLPIEEGANQYPVAQWEKPLRTLSDFNYAVDALLHAKHKYTAVAIDTADALEELLKAHLEAQVQAAAKVMKDAPKTLATLNEDYGAGYDLLRDAWRMVLQRLELLRTERGMHILFAAHVKPEKVTTLDGGEDYVRYSPAISGKKALNLLKAWTDYMLFFKTETFVSKDGKKRTVASYGDRRMYMTQKPIHDAGCRGAVPWPDSLLLDEQVGWDDFWKTRALIETHKSDLPKVLTERADALVARLPDVRGKAAKEQFSKNLALRNYLLCSRICDAMEEEAKEVEIAAGKVPVAAVVSETGANGVASTTDVTPSEASPS